MFNVCPQGVASGDKLFQKKTSARSGIAGQSLKSVAIVLIWIPVCILLNQASAKQISDSVWFSDQFNKKTVKQNDAKLWFTASCETGWIQATDYVQPLRGSRLRQRRRRRQGPDGSTRSVSSLSRTQGSYLCFPSLILPLRLCRNCRACAQNLVNYTLFIEWQTWEIQNRYMRCGQVGWFSTRTLVKSVSPLRGFAIIYTQIDDII